MNQPSHEHPLAQSFERAQTMSPYLRLSCGVPSGEGWLAATDVFAAGQHFDALTRDAQQRLRTRAPNIVASSLLQSYQWQLIAGAIACYLLERRVPELGAASIRLHYNDEGDADAIAFTDRRFCVLRDDPQAGHLDAVVVADAAALRDVLRAALEAHLAQAIEQLCARLGSKPRGLWLNVADGCAGTITWLMQQLDPATGKARIEAEVDALVQAPGSPLNTKQLGLLELSVAERTQVFLDRASCCYWYKTDGGEYCSTCPHRTPADRNEQLIKYMSEAHVEQAGA